MIRKTSQEEAEEEGQMLNQRAGGKSGESGITGVNTDTKTEVNRVCDGLRANFVIHIYSSLKI